MTWEVLHLTITLSTRLPPVPIEHCFLCILLFFNANINKCNYIILFISFLTQNNIFPYFFRPEISCNVMYNILNVSPSKKKMLAIKMWHGIDYTVHHNARNIKLRINSYLRIKKYGMYPRLYITLVI